MEEAASDSVEEIVSEPVVIVVELKDDVETEQVEEVPNDTAVE